VRNVKVALDGLFNSQFAVWYDYLIFQ